MKAAPLKIHIQLSNLFFLYILVLCVLSKLPHAEAPFFSWLNSAIYFLLAVFSFLIVQKEQTDKAVFIYLGLFCSIYSLSIVQLFVGQSYAIGSNELSLYIWQYRKILANFVLTLCLTYLCIRILLKLSVRTSFLLSSLCASIVVLFSFVPFVIEPGILLQKENYLNYDLLYEGIFYCNLFNLLSIFIYGICLYRTERTLGEHVNSLVGCFFILVVLNLSDMLGCLYEIRIFLIKQYILFTTLAFFFIILYRKLAYQYSAYGEFYAKLAEIAMVYGVPIKRKRSRYFDNFFQENKEEHHGKRNIVVILSLFFILCVQILNLPVYLKINLTVGYLALLSLAVYLAALYKKRLSAGNYLVKPSSIVSVKRGLS